MIANFFELFIQGIFVGSTFCLLFCAPIIIPFILGTIGSWKKGFWAILIFFLGRITVYSIFGLFIGLGKVIYIDRFIESQFNFYFHLFAGSFILLAGLLLLLGKRRKKVCPGLEKLIISSNLRSIFILGLFLGTTPCPPLVAAFLYVFVKAENLLSAFFLILAFGLGTSFSPLLFLGPFSGFISQKMEGTKFLQILRICAALILFLWGIKIIISG